MASKQDRFYFDNLAGAAGLCCEAAEYLNECLSDYDVQKLPAMVSRMHETEHRADLYRHEMAHALAHAFITPFDREDIALLSSKIDDVTDAVEAVLQRFYVNRVDKIHPDYLSFAQKIGECCTKTRAAIAELPHYKKSSVLPKLISGIHQSEESCDQLYLNSSLSMLCSYRDTQALFFAREILDYMEQCADACEHVAETVELIVMKNT